MPFDISWERHIVLILDSVAALPSKKHATTG